jgi:hypothetical protein
MRWQTTAVLAAILLIVGGGYYWYEIQQGPEREKAEGRKGRVFTAEPTDVTEAVIKRAGDTIRLKRDGERWKVVEPVAAGGDRGPIDETLTTIVTAKMDREIADKPSALGDFGLDKPAADVTLTLKDGKQLGLSLGSKTPTGVWVYAQERDKPAVFVVPDSVLRDATRPVADFRDKTILAFDRRDVSGLDIVLRDETLALESTDGKWKLTRPRPLPVDDQAIADLFEKLQAAKVKEFVAESPRSLEPYGLERPVRLAIHTGKDKDRAERALLIGKSDDVRKGVYAMRPGESSVLLLPEDVWTAVPKNVGAVRDKSVVTFDREKVTKIDVESPRGAVTLVREQDRWKIAQPESLPADTVEAGALLSRLSGLRAQAFLSEDATGIPRYLSKPEVKVTLTQQGAPAPLTVLLAPAPDKRDGKPTAYAAVAGGQQVVLVDAGSLGDLGKSVDELRDRTLVAGLEPRDVKRLQLRSGGKSVLVERHGESEWQVLEPTKGKAKSGKPEDVLYAVRALKWKSLVAPKGQDAAKYGLDAPATEIGLYRADGTEIATVQVGKREGDRLFLKLKSAPAIYAIDAKQLDLPKVPDDFQG